MPTFRVEIDADGLCGFSTDVEADSRADAIKIAKTQAGFIGNWEVLTLHEPPRWSTDVAVEILSED